MKLFIKIIFFLLEVLKILKEEKLTTLGNEYYFWKFNKNIIRKILLKNVII